MILTLLSVGKDYLWIKTFKLLINTMPDLELTSACGSEEEVYRDFLAWFNKEYNFHDVLWDALDEFLDDYVDEWTEKS